MTVMSHPPLAHPSPTGSDWNWRAELEVLESTLDHVAGGERWDWRRDLRALDDELDQLASRLGL